MLKWGLKMAAAVLFIVFVPLLTGFSCNPVIIHDPGRLETYSRPGYSAVPQPASPLVWIYVYDHTNGILQDAYAAGRAAERILSACGFRSAGVAVHGSYGEQFSPLNQFRLDLVIGAYAGGSGYQSGVTADAILIRAVDEAEIDAGQSIGYYTPMAASVAQALKSAVHGAVRLLCARGYHVLYSRSEILISPGHTLFGWGACGRRTKKGVLDMRYQQCK